MKALKKAALACIVLWLVAQGVSANATTDVSIFNFAFDPTPFTAAQGQTVTWQNNQPATPHTTTSDGADGGTTGVGLWDSSPNHPADDLATTQTFSFEFDDAGTFPYHCRVHSFMHGEIVVELVVPPTGTRGTPFTVRWATGSVTSGFNEDVQMNAPVRRGRKRRWVNAFADQSGSQTQADVTPTRKGVYKFRSRLQNDTTGVRSEFSPTVVVTVS